MKGNRQDKCEKSVQVKCPSFQLAIRQADYDDNADNDDEQICMNWSESDRKIWQRGNGSSS